MHQLPVSLCHIKIHLDQLQIASLCRLNAVTCAGKAIHNRTAAQYFPLSVQRHLRLTVNHIEKAMIVSTQKNIVFVSPDILLFCIAHVRANRGKVKGKLLMTVHVGYEKGAERPPKLIEKLTAIEGIESVKDR